MNGAEILMEKNLPQYRQNDKDLETFQLHCNIEDVESKVRQLNRKILWSKSKHTEKIGLLRVFWRRSVLLREEAVESKFEDSWYITCQKFVFAAFYKSVAYWLTRSCKTIELTSNRFTLNAKLVPYRTAKLEGFVVKQSKYLDYLYKEQFILQTFAIFSSQLATDNVKDVNMQTGPTHSETCTTK